MNVLLLSNKAKRVLYDIVTGSVEGINYKMEVEIPALEEHIKNCNSDNCQLDKLYLEILKTKEELDLLNEELIDNNNIDIKEN